MKLPIPLAGTLAAVLTVVLGTLSIVWHGAMVDPLLRDTPLAFVSWLALVAIVAAGGWVWYVLFGFLSKD